MYGMGQGDRAAGGSNRRCSVRLREEGGPERITNFGDSRICKRHSGALPAKQGAVPMSTVHLG